MKKEKELHHLAIILDGNRRWARQRNLPSLEGHKKGYEKMKQVGDWCLARGIPILTVFVFSTENWNRTANEVKYLMELLAFFLKNDIQDLVDKGVCLKIIGSRVGLSSKIIKLITEAEDKTKHNDKFLFQLALNYGGRNELVDTFKKMLDDKVESEDVTEDLIDNYSYSPGVFKPDMIVRTSGERRISGFLLWHSAYSEFLFLQKYWPDFEESDLDEVIREYFQRQRRYGK